MTENEATREMTFEEEYPILQKEKEELFAMENCDSEPPFANSVVRRASRCIRKLLEEIQQYRAIGTVEELQKAEKEESILKFYYCDSEDSYLVGLRIGNFYYAHYIDGRWIFDMSRHLPWGEHVVDDTTEWKEHTYPSEPKEINFSEWLNGFIKKECGGTVEECRAAVEKQTAKKIVRRKATHEDVESELRDFITRKGMIFRCPTCGCCIAVEEMKSCWECGQKLDWSE